MLSSSVAEVHFCFEEDSRYCEMKGTHRQNSENGYALWAEEDTWGPDGHSRWSVAHVSSACVVKMLPRLTYLLRALGRSSSAKQVLLWRLKV